MTKKEAVKVIDNRFEIMDYCEDAKLEEALDIAIKALEQSERKKGKWIGYKADDKDWQRDDGSPIFMNCSECHEAVASVGSAHWNFCPNCGADLREGDAT